MADLVLKVTTLGADVVTITRDAATGKAPVFGEPEDELNKPGSWSFTIPTDHSQNTTAIISPHVNEAELWRNGSRWQTYRIVSEQTDLNVSRFECEGLLSWAADRCIDRGADRENLLTNPDFESGLTGWTTNNESGLTATADTTRKKSGTQAAKLVSTAYGKQNYLSQSVSYTSTSLGDVLVLAGWHYTQNSGYLGPAYGNRGLYGLVPGGGPGDLGIVEIDDASTRDDWVRVETLIYVPPSTTVSIAVRLYSPGGTNWWDALSLTRYESLFYEETDEATIAGHIWEFIQNQLTGWTVPKSDLLIGQTINTTGTLRTRNYLFHEHTPAEAALDELVANGGFDHAVTPARVYTTYPGGQGTDRTSGVGTVTLDKTNANFVKRVFDGHQAASDIVTLGAGDGPDREEGGASDTAVFDGQTIQRIITPRGEPEIDALDSIAGEELAGMKNPVAYEVEVFDATLVALLGLGDRVLLDYTKGRLNVSGAHRIVKRRLAHNGDTLVCTLNEVI